MSWHYSQALEEAFSEACSLDGAPSVQWRSMPSAPDDSCSDKMKGTCHRSPFGMMFVPSTDAHGEALLTWFREDFLARTSASQERARESTESEAGSGVKWHASFVRYNRDTHSWKTAQLSLFEGLEQSLETWPRWGWMHGGECSVQSTRVPLIDERESGLLPTPTANEYGSCQGVSSGRDGQPNKPSLQTMARKALWPTPRAANPGSRPSGGGGKILQEEVLIADGLRERGKKLFPTPTCADASVGNVLNDNTEIYWLKSGLPRKVSNQGVDGSVGLARFVKLMFPTPQSRDYKGAPGKGCRERGGHQSSLPAEVGGQLNPTWVEWLMGWPLGWTDSSPLETDRFQQWFNSHGRPYMTTNTDPGGEAVKRMEAMVTP